MSASHSPLPTLCSPCVALTSPFPPAVGAVTLISPLELIRTKMQSRQLSYRELRVCIQSAVAQDGWLSLWRGWGPTVLRDVPFSGMAVGWGVGDTGGDAPQSHRSAGTPLLPALYWFNYELVREWLCRQTRLDEATFMVSFVSGAISGTVSGGARGLQPPGADRRSGMARTAPSACCRWPPC